LSETLENIFLIQCVMDNDLMGFKHALVQGASETHMNLALIVAIQERKVPFVVHILPHITTIPHQAFLETIRSNSKPCFELLFPHFSLSDPEAMCFAARLGRIEPLKLIAPHCDIAYNSSAALWLAAQQGHAQCVEFLLNGSAPEDYPTALGWAARNGKRACVDLLLPYVNNPQDIVDTLNDLCPELRSNWEWLEAQLQNQRISGVVDGEQRAKPSKKL